MTHGKIQKRLILDHVILKDNNSPVINWFMKIAYSAQINNGKIALAGDYFTFDHFGISEDDTKEEIKEKIIEWFDEH